MAEESFLMVSLDDEKSKKLAQVISNNTSRKILSELSKKKMTETELSKRMKLPMSTIHYNLKALEEAKLIQADEYHYSEKGKEVNHYSLTNKFVIIAPKTEENLWSKFKSLIPAIGTTIVASGILFFTTLQRKTFNLAGADTFSKAADDVQMLRAAPEAASAAGDNAVQHAPNLIHSILTADYAWLWFILGVIFFLLSLWIITMFRKNTSPK